MLQKIKDWWRSRKPTPVVDINETDSYTRDQVENAYVLGYNDGRQDGLTIARDQATKSLKEILWEQNKKSPK